MENFLEQENKKRKERIKELRSKDDDDTITREELEELSMLVNY